MHVASQLERHGFLLATFIHERKHRHTKQAAELRYSKKSMELGMIEELTANQLHDMAQPFLDDVSLPHPVKVPASLMTQLVEEGIARPSSQAFTGTRLMVHHTAVCRGDVATYQRGDGSVGVGEVLLHVVIDGFHWTCLSLWEILGSSNDAYKCIRRDDAFFCRAPICSRVVFIQ